MRSPRLGAVLLVAGGLLLAAEGFMPPGHPQSHWTLFGESLDGLLHPDPDLEHRFGESAFFSAKIIAFVYPALAGAAFALTPFIGRFRSGFWALGLLHPLVSFLLAAMAITLALPSGDPQANSHAGPLVGLAVLLGAVCLLEIRGLRRALRHPEPSGRLERATLGPALFLLAINLSCLVGLRRFEDWPLAAYWMGSAGSGLAAMGAVLRAPRRRAAAIEEPVPGPSREPAGVA